MKVSLSTSSCILTKDKKKKPYILSNDSSLKHLVMVR